ncbi:MAG: ABC transporter permease [Clostridiales bacterium]|nr:ABC transporter permease [Clostridiales bacterium]
MFKQLREVFAYKQMLISTVKKDLRSRYRGSILGFLWTFINPLMQLVVYSVVFKRLLRATEDNYAMFVFTALLPWLYCVSSIQASTTCIVSNSNLVKKIYFPRMILPISVSTTGIINYIFGLVIVFPALIITGVKLTPFALLMPIIMAVQFLFVTGLCMMLSAFYVYFRDLEHIVGIVTMVWFYLTPILYNINIFEGNFKKLLGLNPMTQIVLAYRNVLLYGTHPSTTGFLGVTGVSVAIFFLGAFIFSKLQGNFAEEL